MANFSSGAGGPGKSAAFRLSGFPENLKHAPLSIAVSSRRQPRNCRLQANMERTSDGIGR